MKTNIYQTLHLRKGNVYKHLSDEEAQWLIDEAVRLDRCDIGLIIASIISDAYHEEKGEENEESR
mgnify:CR=1 FL=1